eukprot:COSAG02_NODE_20871_length_812_cov_2.018233_1_plen_75_part_00
MFPENEILGTFKIAMRATWSAAVISKTKTQDPRPKTQDPRPKTKSRKEEECAGVSTENDERVNPYLQPLASMVS